MAHSTHTLKLNETWDLTLSDTGNILTTTSAMATAQNAANECRLFTEDAYFDYDKGIPHFITELGSRMPPKSLLRSFLRRAVLRVPDVSRVTDIELFSFDRVNRVLSGRILFSTREGVNVQINI
jgi:hypothetical protein